MVTAAVASTEENHLSDEQNGIDFVIHLVEFYERNSGSSTFIEDLQKEFKVRLEEISPEDVLGSAFEQKYNKEFYYFHYVTASFNKINSYNDNFIVSVAFKKYIYKVCEPEIDILFSKKKWHSTVLMHHALEYSKMFINNNITIVFRDPYSNNRDREKKCFGEMVISEEIEER